MRRSKLVCMFAASVLVVACGGDGSEVLTPLAPGEEPATLGSGEPGSGFSISSGSTGPVPFDVIGAGSEPGGASQASLSSGAIRGEALDQLLIDEVPWSYILQGEGESPTGPVDISRAAQDDGLNDALAFLAEHGFAGGYQRVWHRDNIDYIYIRAALYRFEGEQGAAEFLTRTLTRVGSFLVARGPVERIAVAGVPGATGIRSANGSARNSFVAFTRGPLMAFVEISDQDPNDQYRVAEDLARKQFARL